VLMLRRSGRSPKSTTWKWWGRRYSNSPSEAQKQEPGYPERLTLRQCTATGSFSFSMAGRPACSEVPVGARAYKSGVSNVGCARKSRLARPVPHVAYWPEASFAALRGHF